MSAKERFKQQYIELIGKYGSVCWPTGMPDQKLCDEVMEELLAEKRIVATEPEAGHQHTHYRLVQ